MLAIIITLLVVAAAVVLIAGWQTRSNFSEAQAPRKLHGENFRPLFALDEAELQAIERDHKRQADAKTLQQKQVEREEKLATLEDFRQTWRESPSRINTIELLRRASEAGSGQVFSHTVDEMLRVGPKGLQPGDIVALVESHFWLLPRHERTPGVKFTIDRALATVREESHTRLEEEASDPVS
jgi:hypothetical protein